MIGRGLVLLTVLSNCVLSLPVTSSQLENEDVKVMKCIVEALADVLSRPRPLPVSQECLVVLKADDRLVTILRHHNFLKELQEIALQGGQERAELQRDASTSGPTTHTPQTADDGSDRSMLEALGGPGERSILSQQRRAGNGDEEGEKAEGPRDGDEEKMEEVKEKREDEESPGSHVSESVEEWSEGKAEKREDEEEEEEEEGNEDKRSNSAEEENMRKKNSAASEEKRDPPRHESKEVEEKRSPLPSRKHVGGEEEEAKRATKRAKGLRQRKTGEEEVPHHSKEVTEEEEKKKKRDTQRSPEEKELRMMAGGPPEERKALEEEGSASRKSEEPEIESLAAIESELENVAQKLHELRRG